MIEQNYLILIKRIANQLYSQNVNWAITGSANFALQGLPFRPSDIDIQTDKDGAYKIEKIFKAYSKTPVEFLSNGRIRSHFGSLIIDGIKVEIMGDLEKLVDGNWEKTPDLNKIIRTINIENISFPVLSLEYEAEAYNKLGRNDKADIIYNYIKNNY